MVVYTRVTVGGTDYNDDFSIVVKASTGEYNSSSTFTIVYPNHNGLHNDDFTMGAEVIIYAEQDVNPPTVKIITSIIEDIRFEAVPHDESVTITGRDYTARLQDASIPPVVYNNQEVSTIVTNIMSTNVTNVTTTNVDVTPITLNNIVFNHMNAFDALKKLADVSGFYFYVDTDKDLHFELKGAISSGTTLNNTNVINAKFTTNDDSMYNETYVYGDRLLTAYTNSFTANGGSVYNLDWNPHNTEVLVGGSTAPKVGGIFDVLQQTDVGSPVQYMVDYYGKRIIFVSGTNAGHNIPVSGTDAIVVNYQRSTPIIKLARDETSILTYGRKTKVITDKTIKDPQMARDLALDTVHRFKDPLDQGTLQLRGVVRLVPGNTVVVNLPNQNISSRTFDLLECTYNFNIENNRANRVLTVKVARKVADVMDTIKQMILDIKKLQADQTITPGILSRLEVSTGSVGCRVKEWFIRTRGLGSSFIIGNTTMGDLGSGTDQVNPQTYLGDSRGALTVILSGGEV